MKQSFKDSKVSVSVFSADISKSEEISRWRPIDKAFHCDFSAPKSLRRFSKIATIILSGGLTFFPAMGSTRSETKLSLSYDLRGNTQTQTHTHTHTHTQVLRESCVHGSDG